MVWKCCVPGCSSKSRFPAHKLPVNIDKAHAWLRAIQRTDMIDAPKEIISKLRICTDHFAEDMIINFTQRRRLKDNAIPSLHLLESIENINTDSDDIVCENNQNSTTVLSSENVNTSNLMPALIKASKEKQDNTNQSVMSEIHYLRKKLRRSKKLVYNKKRIIRIQRQTINKKLTKDSTNEWEKLSSEASSAQKTFLEMIIKNFKSAPQGHRYETSHKALALTMYKTMGKRAYTYLRNVFKDIPSIQTLQLLLQNIPISTGLNPFILKHLTNTASTMSIKDKVCILMWDEISIQANVTYDSRNDVICGFEDWDNNRTTKIADHALVFMLRGLNTGWKIPVSYSFCQKQTNKTQLIRCIKEHICKLSNAGFNIVATVCDQGSSNMAVINELLLRTDIKRNFERRSQRQTFEIGNIEIIPLFDPPHLIKGIRNNLLTKNLIKNYNEKNITRAASWEIIKTAWIIDRNINTIRPQLKKITKEHVLENKIKKMRVKHATQILSGTVASCIETLTKSKCAVLIDESLLTINYEEGITTAEIINFFNDLFDSVNANTENDNELRSPVTEDSAHHSFWIKAVNILQNMRYVDKVNPEIVKSVPTLKNWLFTVNGFRKLWEVIHVKYDFNIFKTRYCNQDPLENFFSLIRSHHIRHTNPTPRQFQYSFITLLVNNMKSIKIVGGNCEITKDASSLFSLELCLQTNKSNVPHNDNNEEINDEPHELLMDNVVSEESLSVLLSENLQDIIGAILKRLKYCQQCENSLNNSEFPVYARQIVCMIKKLLKTRAHRRNIFKVLLQYFHEWNVNINWHECIEHHNDIFKIVIRIIILKVLVWWCNTKNNLIGTEKEDVLIKSGLECTQEIIRIRQERNNNYITEKSKRKRMLLDYKQSVRKRVKL